LDHPETDPAISKTSQVAASQRHFGELYFVAQKVMKQLETLVDAEVEHYLNATFKLD
jgi:hypothetical protein